MIRRSDVVVADFPFADGGSKRRPAVAVQCDRLNGKLANTVLAMITGNTRFVGREPTHFLIDPATPDGKSADVKHISAVKGHNLVTVARSSIIHTLGHLSDPLMQQLNDCLRAALEL